MKPSEAVKKPPTIRFMRNTPLVEKTHLPITREKKTDNLPITHCFFEEESSGRGKKGAWQAGGREEAGTQEPRQAGMLAGRQANSQAGRQAGRKPTPPDPPHSRLCILIMECGKRAKMAGYGGDSCICWRHLKSITTSA